MAVASISSRFQQGSSQLYLSIHNLILSAAKGQAILPAHVRPIFQHFGLDSDERPLRLHLQLLPDVMRGTEVKELSGIIDGMKTLGRASHMRAEVINLISLLEVIPATPATAEGSFSSLKRLKTHLRSTMMQRQLNNMLVLHGHEENRHN